MSAINEKAVNGTQLQRTHKKIYRHLMPLLIVAYIISFIDRTNIGMAKATMSVDIGLSATAFGLGAGLFFLTYAVLEIPSNLFLTRIGARRWIARIMITWGILSCGMAFVTGPTSFYVMRLLLGAAEAGLYPGIIYYLTLWFGREERAKATGLFLLGVCLANIIGAPLGGLLLSLDGMSGWHGWQWMFFIEGLPAIALAFVVWRRLPDKPADARWLDSDDVQSIIFNWLPSIMSGHMLAGSFGLLNCLGLCGGFLGPFILGAFEDRTGAATSGLWFAVALLIIGALVSLFLKSSSSPGSVSAKQAHGEKV
ncbi:MFS transporter [Klebsiella pneumoniae]|nr:MFS transporter [Klebsiella pneumoniae]